MFISHVTDYLIILGEASSYLLYSLAILRISRQSLLLLLFSVVSLSFSRLSFARAGLIGFLFFLLTRYSWWGAIIGSTMVHKMMLDCPIIICLGKRTSASLQLVTRIYDGLFDDISINSFVNVTICRRANGSSRSKNITTCPVSVTKTLSILQGSIYTFFAVLKSTLLFKSISLHWTLTVCLFLPTVLRWVRQAYPMIVKRNEFGSPPWL